MNLKQKTLLFAGSVTAAVVVAMAGSAWQDYVVTRARAEATAVDVANFVSKHVEDTVAQSDNVMAVLARPILDEGGLSHAQEPARRRQLQTYCKLLVGCTAIGVTDAEGRMVALSGSDAPPEIRVDDRAFFRLARDTGKLVVDSAIVSRLPGSPIVFTVAKPVLASDGRLLAVLAVAMDTAHLTALYERMRYGIKPTITVMKSDGQVVARHPDMRSFVGRKITSDVLSRHREQGVFEVQSVLDGRKMLAAYRALPGLDLLIFAGLDREQAFDSWRKRTLIMSVLGLGVLVLILGMAFGGYRSLERQLALEVRNRRLHHLSHEDALTGIANRRAFDGALEHEWARHRRHGSPLALLMVDVDYFKQYNDEYGHQAGDECLIAIANTLQDCLRRGVDLVARYGGEEFSVLLSSEQEGAVQVAEQLRAAVAALVIPHGAPGASGIVTISIGMACTGAVSASSARDFVALADHALYEAKQAGRNCVYTSTRDKSGLTLVQ